MITSIIVKKIILLTFVFCLQPSHSGEYLRCVLNYTHYTQEQIDAGENQAELHLNIQSKNSYIGRLKSLNRIETITNRLLCLFQPTLTTKTTSRFRTTWSWASRPR